MKAVRTLPSWKCADSLFLCVLLITSVPHSTTPLPPLFKGGKTKCYITTELKTHCKSLCVRAFGRFAR